MQLGKLILIASVLAAYVSEIVGQLTPASKNSLHHLRHRPGRINRATNIPLILHQAYGFAQEDQEVDVARSLEEIQALWPWQPNCVLHHRRWEYILWSPRSADAFIAEHYPQHIAVYRGYSRWISRADAIRVFALHHFGGLYLDMDIECLRDGEDLLETYELVLQGTDHEGVTNAVVASIKGHRFWEYCMEEMQLGAAYADNWDVGNPIINTTGPSMFGRAFRCMLQPSDCRTPESLQDFVADRLGHQLHDGSLIMVYPVGAWYTPCFQNAECQSKFEESIMQGSCNLTALAGHHRYTGSWG